LAAAGYSNLEYDLATGERGKRGGYLEENLALLFGAQAATVVNNCAAALILLLRHFARPPREEVVISRGELVQIGGGFRIPEILEASGLRLREVGTTNKTTLNDYARALGPKTALLLKVHRSNFFMGGFVSSPALEEIAGLARKKRIPLVEDLGSGAAVRTEALARIEHEPTPAESLRHGVDVVCCSGDKLFGGPQAGLIFGRARVISALKREPFFRALRCDKLVLSSLQATVDLYLQDGSEASIPGLEMLRRDVASLRTRAEQLRKAIQDLPLGCEVGQSQAQLGGGAMPRSSIESVALELTPAQCSVVELASRLRQGAPPVIGLIADGVFKLDLRTVSPQQDHQLTQRLREACGSCPS
jgi:L-seryl-tRNA(Ser) seleniumtransferase